MWRRPTPRLQVPMVAKIDYNIFILLILLDLANTPRHQNVYSHLREILA